ncbi:hypothetical protein BJ508DRAFT_305218 [Ascobolus immersus RN42]|uniref:Cyanovirin-N domain-containing protein n=1 Tax=Ascobolus immersus RN42 TaxID=1160509 RepID=A0A3N4IFJ8_ASCIM|nr:hypothetical protein BJ508DRAFT_305218 [Ascobolus immersus RN42]
MKFTATALLTSTLFLPSVSAVFYASCQQDLVTTNVYTENGKIMLKAMCKTNDNQRRRTKLDLGLCMANENGSLIVRKNGNLGNSCKDPSLWLCGKNLPCISASCTALWFMKCMIRLGTKQAMKRVQRGSREVQDSPRSSPDNVVQKSREVQGNCLLFG